MPWNEAAHAACSLLSVATVHSREGSQPLPAPSTANAHPTWMPSSTDETWVQCTDFPPNRMQIKVRRLFIILELISLLVLCSCATAPTDRNELPQTLAIDEETGRGQLLIVKIRLGNGEQLPFLLDTGT